MSNFLYPPKFMVFQSDDSGNTWVPALFTHRDCCPYFVVGETLEELIPYVTGPGVNGDADPILDLRVVEIGSGDLYKLKSTLTEFVQVVNDSGVTEIDSNWFDFN